MIAMGKPGEPVTPPRSHPPLGSREAARRQPRHPCPPAVPGFLALLLRVGVSINMYIRKPEPTVEELLSDPVMVTMLQHSRTTADDVRALLNRTRERPTKASAADASELPPVGALS